MNIHKNARLTPLGRAELARRVLEDGAPVAQVAREFHVCCKTVRKWAERRRAAGVERLCDRSSRPHRMRAPTPQIVIDDIIALRRQRFTGKHIAGVAGVSAAAESRGRQRGDGEPRAQTRRS
jgi:transposase-like protein